MGNGGSLRQGEEHHDPARNEDILGRTPKRLELWEEHLKDPMRALEKSVELLGESLLGLTSGSQLLVASRVGCDGLQFAGCQAVNNCAHTLAVLVLCIFSTCRAFPSS